MQGKSYSLRLGFVALVVVLVFGALGSLSLAKDAFDDDYTDCPASTRLAALDGLTIDRTDEDDEIRVSWNELSPNTLRTLGNNGYKARLTIIVDKKDGEDPKEHHVALGDKSKTFDGIEFTKELEVSVAMTLGDHVISDIVETDFTSGMPAPSFSTSIMVSSTDDGEVDGEAFAVVGPSKVSEAGGKFYYLGFNDLFDNWYVLDKGTDPILTSPVNPKFRVGLNHGAGDLVADDADFEHYRIVIEDSKGDLLGFQARTVESASTYKGRRITFGATGTDYGYGEDGSANPGLGYFTNIRLSNQVRKDAVDPYFVNHEGPDSPKDSSYGNVDIFNNPSKITPRVGLYAEPPMEHFDFAKDIFEKDGLYTIKAWAEDEDDVRISPQASIVLSVREQGKKSPTKYQGYNNEGIRTWGESDNTAGASLMLFGFSIEDEDDD